MSELQLSSLQHGVVFPLPTVADSFFPRLGVAAVEGLRDLYAKNIAERS